nr:hypothetical protein [Tanacetum cinerariifolium]
MINSIQNGDQPLPVIAQASLAETAQNAPPTLKEPKFWTAEEKKTRKIDRLARSLLIQGLSNDIYSLIDSKKTAKDLWDALARHMLGSKYGEQDRKAGGSKKKTVVATYDPLALIAEKTKVSKSKEKVISSDSKGSETDDFSELKKITALLAKAFNPRKFYSKPTNNNLRTSSTSHDSDQEINANMVFMAQIEIVLSDSEASSSSTDEQISEELVYPSYFEKAKDLRPTLYDEKVIGLG